MNFKLILVILISSFLLPEDCDGHCFTDEEVQSFRNDILQLEHSDSTNTKIIFELENQINLFNQKSFNDSLIMNQYKYQLQLKDELIEEIRPKWYDNKYLWFFGGIMTIYISSEMVSNIK
tara:strand:+ start:270 stop:629 length:360 start_codon:yes stop_codon:yes gene_type:complete